MTRLEAAALRWATARLRRLEAGKERVKAYKAPIEKWGSVALRIDADERLTQARKRESSALRQLIKACANERGSLNEADVIDVMPTLPMGRDHDRN